MDRGTTEGHLETDGANLLGKLMHRTCYIRERLLALPTTHPPPSLYSLLTPLHYCVLVYLPVGFIMGNVPYAGAEWLVLEPRKCCDEESWGRDGVVGWGCVPVDGTSRRSVLGIKSSQLGNCIHDSCV